MKESTRIRISGAWTEAQWDDAVQVENVITGILGDKPNLSAADFTALVIEERKLDSKAEIIDILDLVILLGTESMFQLRHNQRPKSKTRKACTVSPDVAELAKGRRKYGVPGRVRGI